MNKPTRSRGTVAVTVAIVMAVVVGLLFWGYSFSATPRFCSSCHLMETRYIGWERSTHASAATCLECHSAPGTFGEIKAHIGGARYIWVILTRKEWTGFLLKSQVNDSSCLKCHQAEGLPVQSGDHEIDHDTHAANGVACFDCHGSLAHGTLGGQKERPILQICLDCHDPGNERVCNRCHLTGQVLRSL